MLGRLAQAADDADQSLRAQRDGSTGAVVPYQEHDGISLQDRRLGRHRHEQERDDKPLMIRKSKGFPALALVLLFASCTTIGTNTSGSAQIGTASSRWTDS